MHETEPSVPDEPKTESEMTPDDWVVVGTWENMALDALSDMPLRDPGSRKDVRDMIHFIANQYDIDPQVLAADCRPNDSGQSIF